MPVSGTGILPPAGGVFNELSFLTRRAFVPALIVQIYQASPTLALFLANAQHASGGVGPMTVPVQGAAYVTTQAAGYDGSFTQPAVQQGAFNAEYNLKLQITPIPFLGMEAAVQVNAAVIPILEARMNDAGNSIADYLSTKLWGNAIDGLDIVGFPGAITNTGTYGNINRATNVFWQANVRTVAASPAPTRGNLLQQIVSATKFNGGEMPTFGVAGPGTWANLAQDFLAQEFYTLGPGEGFDKAQGGTRAAFTALVIAGVPFYMDPYATEGQFIIGNDKYGLFYLHEDVTFQFTGFVSTLPNFQVGYVGALLNLVEFVLLKSKAWTSVTGYAFLSV